MLQVNVSIFRLKIAMLIASLVYCAASAQPFRRVALPTQGMLPMTNIHCLLQDSDGTMWYGTPGEGICRDNGYQVDVFRLPISGEESNHVIAMVESRALGEIWFSTRYGLFALSKRDFTIRSVHPCVNGKRVNAIVEGHDHSLWVSARDTVYHFSPKGALTARYASVWHGRKANVVNLMEDHQGRIWCTQWNGGLMYIEDSRTREVRWQCESYPECIVEDAVRGCYYVGTWGAGIVKMVLRDDDATFTALPLHARDGATSRQVIHLLHDARNQRLWCVTMSGLSAFDTSMPSGQPRLIDLSSLQLPPTAVLDQMCMDRDGNLWVAGFSPSTFAIIPTGESAQYGRKIEGDVGLRITVSGNKAWMLADREGLQYYDLNTGERLSVPNETVDPFEKIPFIAGEEHQCQDGQGHLWLQDNNSVVEMNLQNGAHRRLSVTDGSLPLEYVKDICPARDGVCVTGARGLVLLPHCEAMDGKAEDAMPVVTAYMVDDSLTRCSIYPDIQLSAHFKTLTLQLTTHSPLHTHNIQMAWRLSSENDSLWHELPVGTNEVTLHRLPLGKQKVLVKTTDRYGRWGQPHEVATCHRLPTWYETPWFYAAAGLLLLLTVFGIVRLRQQHEREMEELRQQFVRQIEAMQRDPLPPTVSSETIEETEETTEQPKLTVLDQEFIDKAIQSVNKHMNDGHFTVDQFADELCMSRMNLYRRMRSTTGMSPSDFIKNQRLEHAAHLLLTTSHSIVTIADLCGFSTPSYFTKCFKEKFGITPNEGRK